ncbi:MAG: hypothetical protein Hens3KO_15230 [Henriciella sp.]
MKVHYLEIVTSDVDGHCAALATASGAVFSAPVEALGNARIAPLDGQGRIGVRAPMSAEEQPTIRPYVLTNDIQAALEVVVSIGGEIAHPPLEIPGEGTFAIYFLDGNQHGLWQL